MPAPTPRKGILDTRNGLGYSVNIQLSYESEKKIGIDNITGLDKFVSFLTVPYYTKKTTVNIIAVSSDWDTLFSEMESETLSYSNSQIGSYLDSVNPGSRLFIAGIENFDGSYSETFTSASVGGIVTKKFGSRSGSVSVGGHWQGSGTIANKMFFNTTNYGEQATETLTDVVAGVSIGGNYTVAGVTGKVTSIAQNNPRVVNNIIVYDYSITVSATTGTSI